MVKRIISTDFWDDEKVIDQFSPEDKYFMLYLLTNPKTTSIGIYKLPKKIASFDLGYTRDTINVLLDRFQNKYEKIVYFEEEQEIAVLNSLKYTISKGGKPIEDMVERELKAVKSTGAIKAVYDHLSTWWSWSDRAIDESIQLKFENELTKRSEAFKRKEAKEKNTNTNANTNANANTESLSESLSESVDDSWKPIGNQMETQVSIGKDSLVKESKDKDSQEENVVIGAIDFYQQNFGILNPYTSQQIVDAIETFNDDIVIKAMQIALENNVRNYNYVRAILKKWYEHNATTIEDIESLEVEHKNKQAKKSYGKSQKESVAPKWLNQETRQEKYQGKETTTKPKQMSDDELAELEALKNFVLGGN